MKIAIASGKGGTGKTLISTNLFHVISELGIPVTLIDCDAEEPNDRVFISGTVVESIPITQRIPSINTEKCTFCGRCSEYCNYNAIVFLRPTRFIKVVEELCHDCGACWVACEFGAIGEKEKVLGEVQHFKVAKNSWLIEACTRIGVYTPVPVVKRAIAEANGEGVTLLDAPPGTSCPFVATVESADYVILVTEPTPFGLNDLKLSVEVLEMLGKPFGVIINRSGLGDASVLNYIKGKGIELLMEIPFSKQIAECYSKGELIVERIPDYRQAFSGLLDRIEEIQPHR